MGSITVDITSPTHTPHRFSLTVDRSATVQHLKEQVRQRLHEPSPPVTDLALLCRGSALEDTDTLDKFLEKVDCPTSAVIQLTVSPIHHSITDAGAGQAGEEPASPAPVRFRDASGLEPFPTQSRINMDSSSATGTVKANMTGDNSNNSDNSNNNSDNNSNNSNANKDAGTICGDDHAIVTPQIPSPPPISYPTMWPPFQYAYVNGMPYLIPSSSLPLLHFHHYASSSAAGHPLDVSGPDGYGGHLYPAAGHQQRQPPSNPLLGQQNPAVANDAQQQQQRQDNAARDQRRAAALWLLLKLALGVYMFSQNGSIERIVLLHIVALVIFLHQTGRLRIVRRIARPPQDVPQAQGVPAAPGPAVPDGENAERDPTPFAGTTPMTDQIASTSSSPVAAEAHQVSQSGSNPAEKTIHSEESVSSKPPTKEPAGSSEPTKAAVTATSASTAGLPDAPTTTTTDQPQSQPQPQPTVAASDTAQQPRASTWRNVEHALLTFVTSLIPAPPPPEIEQQAAANAAAADRVL